MRSQLTKEKYENFLKVAHYDAGEAVQSENNQNLKTCSIKEFCQVQHNKFHEGNQTGCCLNFSMYLLFKYEGYLLTCNDNGGVHCAFLYEKNGQLYVCDPAKAKIDNNGKNYFDVPLHEYSFSNGDKPQLYRIHNGLKPEDDQHKFMEVFANQNAQIVTKDLKSIDEKNLLTLFDEKHKHEWLRRDLLAKSWLTEFENEIYQIEFDIDKEKQKIYQFLTKEVIKEFLKSKVFSNTDDISIRKLIVNTFIKEIILYSDKIIITYRFTNPIEYDKITPESTKAIEKESKSALIVSSDNSQNFQPD